MDIETISMEIVKIRSRLRDIEKERKRGSDEEALGVEEQELRTRLLALQDMTTEKGSLSKEMAKQQKGKTRPEEFVTPG